MKPKRGVRSLTRRNTNAVTARPTPPRLRNARIAPREPTEDPPYRGKKPQRNRGRAGEVQDEQEADRRDRRVDRHVLLEMNGADREQRHRTEAARTLTKPAARAPLPLDRAEEAKLGRGRRPTTPLVVSHLEPPGSWVLPIEDARERRLFPKAQLRSAARSSLGGRRESYMPIE
jgi:hypothetical protein